MKANAATICGFTNLLSRRREMSSYRREALDAVVWLHIYCPRKINKLALKKPTRLLPAKV